MSALLPSWHPLQHQPPQPLWLRRSSRHQRCVSQSWRKFRSMNQRVKVIKFQGASNQRWYKTVYYIRVDEVILVACHTATLAPSKPSSKGATLSHDPMRLQTFGIKRLESFWAHPIFFHKKTENPRRKKSMHWMPSQPIENSTQLSGWDCRTVFDSEIRYFSRSGQNSSSNFSASTLISCQEKFWKISSHISKSQAPYRESIWKNNKTTWRWLIFRWKEYQRFSA